MGAKIGIEDDVGGFEHRLELLLDIGTDTRGTISWLQRKTPRKVACRQRPYGAKSRSSLPFAPQRRHAGLDPTPIYEDPSDADPDHDRHEPALSPT